MSGTIKVDCPLCDDELEVSYEVEAGERQTHDYPGSPDNVTVSQPPQCVAGCDISEEVWDEIHPSVLKRAYEARYERD